MRALNGLRDAASFLTRVPVGGGASSSEELARAVPWFPVVGALVGLAVAGVYALALLALPPLVAATLAVTAGVLVTGGFHEDGLADAIDGFGGGWDREGVLRIMKDSRQGSFGVLALVLSTLVRVACLASFGGVAAVAIVPSAHALGRAGGVGVMGALPAARGDGLGSAYLAVLRRSAVVAGIVVGLVIGALGLGAWVGPAAVLVALAAVLLGALAMRKAGGVTGDVLGAVCLTGELVVLCLGAGLVTHHPALTGWWRA